MSLKKMTAFSLSLWGLFQTIFFHPNELIHVCSYILCSFNGKVFKHRKEKPAFFNSIFASLLSVQIVTLHIIYESWLLCNAMHFEDDVFLFCLFINKVLPSQSMCYTIPPSEALGLLVFLCNRGPATLKLFIRFHVGRHYALTGILERPLRHH